MKKDIYTTIDITFNEKETKLIDDTIALLKNLFNDIEDQLGYRYTCYMGGVPTKNLHDTIDVLSELLAMQLSFRSKECITEPKE